MVELDDLHRIEVRSRDVREMHHQHGADRKVRRHDSADALCGACCFELVDIGGGEARGADYRRGACRDRRQGVVQSLRRPREVNQSAGPLGVEELGEVIAAADAAHILEARFVLERRNEDRADLAAMSSDGNASRLGHLPNPGVDACLDPRRCGRHGLARRTRRRRARAPGRRALPPSPRG